MSAKLAIFCFGMLSLALAAIGLPGTAHAAVRMCYAPVSSEIVRAQSEREAKAEALAQWRAKAATLGDGFTSWRLAAQKALKCFKEQGQFACVAFGQPCIIEQNPKRPPAGNDGNGQSL